MNEAEIKQAAKDYTDSIFGVAAINHLRSQIEEGFKAGALAKEPKWIQVTEARPANPRFVIVCNAGKVVHGFYFEGKWYASNIEQPLNNVTEYMEFPSPPNTQP